MNWIKNMIFWYFIGVKPKPRNSPAILLFEIGPNQVFYFPTPEELTRGLLPTEVYWQSTKTKQTYGPFPGINQAMIHYTRHISTLKSVSSISSNVIQVDFKNKIRK